MFLTPSTIKQITMNRVNNQDFVNEPVFRLSDDEIYIDAMRGINNLKSVLNPLIIEAPSFDLHLSQTFI